MDDPFEQVRRYQERAEQGLLTDEEARAWYAIVCEARRLSEYYERNLIRYLRQVRKLKWREVAELLGVESRQGAHQRWRRLAPITVHGASVRRSEW